MTHGLSSRIHGLFSRIGATLHQSPGIITGMPTLAVVLLWSAEGGGFDPLVYLPGTLFLVGLTVVAVVLAPGSIPGGRAGKIALGALGGFTLWSYSSILWAGVRADAWAGSNKTLAYFAVFVLFAARPWRATPAAVALGAYAVGIASVGLVGLMRIAQAADPLNGFIAGRLAVPIDYANANCALYIGAALPALFLAGRREVPTLARATLLASASILINLGILCQSRASLATAPIAVLLVLAVVPNRLRALCAIGIVVIVAAVMVPTLVDVYPAVIDGPVPAAAAVDQARTAIVGSAAVLFLIGLAWGALDRKLCVPPRVTLVLGRAVAVGTVVLLIAGAATALHRNGDPIDASRGWWERFKTNQYVTDPGTPHLVSGFGSGRYEIWRVATKIFVRKPLQGIGVDNFAVDYARERRNQQDPLYPHSLVLRTLEQTGLVGASLLLTFFACIAVVGWRSRRSGSSFQSCLTVCAGAVPIYWVVHGSVDWLWEIPGLSGGAFAFAGLIVGMSGTSSSTPGTRPRTSILLAILIGLAALVAIVPPWLSARAVDTAVHSWVADPEHAYRQLSTARRLNPLSTEPDAVGSVIAAQLGDAQRERDFLLSMMRRNPDDWYPLVVLGALDARQGHRAAAVARLQQAMKLNPRGDIIMYVNERIQDGDPPSQAEIEDLFLRKSDLLTGTVQR